MQMNGENGEPVARTQLRRYLQSERKPQLLRENAFKENMKTTSGIFLNVKVEFIKYSI